MKKIVIIPAYNESGSLLQAVKDIEEHAPGFDYLVVNDKVSAAAEEIIAILTAEGCRTKNRMNFVEGV